jgi:hypothetical protein
MDAETVAMCVITVIDAPESTRWAVVAFRTNVSEGALSEERTWHLSVDKVLDQVSAFLTAAGIAQR